MPDEFMPRSDVPRRVVASFETYPEAQRAVDYLSDQKFPVQSVAIVAQDLRMVEQVTGRMNYGYAILSGALSGGIAGALFGFIFGLFNWIAPVISAFNLALYGLVFGAIAGTIVGLVAHALSGGRRDFRSVTGLQAARYDLMVEDRLADEAARLLERMRTRIEPPEREARGTGWTSGRDTTIPST